MDILVATGNAHKLSELASAFSMHHLIPPAEAGFPDFDVEEDGKTFLENALKKARALHRVSGLPTLADDSGLSVRAMDGAPGVLSARYGSPDGSRKLETAERNALLLEHMANHEDRDCAFVCALALVLGEERFFVVQETCPGKLLRAPRGRGGFGYDPIVYLPELGKSVAELSQAEKNRVSHRGRASLRMAALLAQLEG